MVMLLVRELRYPESGENQHNGLVWVMPRRAHVGDVVAFPAIPRRSARATGSWSAGSPRSEGGALESSDPNVPDATVPREHAWVVATTTTREARETAERSARWT